MTTTALIGTTKGLFVLTGERGGTFAEAYVYQVPNR